MAPIDNEIIPNIRKITANWIGEIEQFLFRKNSYPFSFLIPIVATVKSSDYFVGVHSNSSSAFR
jgi:hypothetical protein